MAKKSRKKSGTGGDQLAGQQDTEVMAKSGTRKNGFFAEEAERQRQEKAAREKRLNNASDMDSAIAAQIRGRC